MADNAVMLYGRDNVFFDDMGGSGELQGNTLLHTIRCHRPGSKSTKMLTIISTQFFKNNNSNNNNDNNELLHGLIHN